ncbi:aspartyl-phosphate phosphatase Spo0E family protein [Camelliibacillus cellulosilyticus]|uniref:Aspartyl-phosphate phosphatase Spo0E family protein n=1 Tax=Camelliibacillus cellulosilyticus TaxID=2174486 RepID=A0ABV9GFU0_9BACL
MLYRDIEKKRAELIETINKYGLVSSKTLLCSRELDRLLARYQMLQSPRPARFKDIC